MSGRGTQGRGVGADEGASDGAFDPLDYRTGDIITKCVAYV